LLEKELAFFTGTPKLFPKMNLQWDAPFQITNAIIDIDNTSTYEIQSTLDQLEDINCQNIQFRFFKHIIVNDVENIISYLDNQESIITSVDFVFPFNESFTKANIDKLRYENARLSSMMVYNHKESKFIEPIDGKRGYVIFSKMKISSKLHCG